jgi:hypothetical protein
MIDDDECALWRQAVASPPVAGALEVYCDLLETRDPARARFLRKRMRGKGKDTAKEEKVWIEALGLERCESIDFDPLPKRVCIDAARVDCLDPVLAQLPFLHVHLAFDTTGGLASIFATPAAGKLRALSFRAHYDQIDPEEIGVALKREYFDNEVLAALCASPNMSQLECLWLLANALEPDCAARLAGGQLVALRELWISGRRIGDAGALALASAPFAATLRTLRLDGCRIGDAGARALAALPLEKLDLSRNEIGPEMLATLGAVPHVTV